MNFFFDNEINVPNNRHKSPENFVMTDLQGLIRDDHLMSVVYDKGYLQKVLDEILVLFQNQTKRIDAIDVQLPLFATKEAVAGISDEIGEMEERFVKQISDVSEKFGKLEENTKKQIQAMIEHIDTSNLDILAETKRYINSEIENFAPAFKPEKNPLEEKFDNLTSDFEKLKEEFRGLPTVQQNERTTALENDVQEMKVRLSQITEQLKTYPDIESDVNNLVLQFPAVTKRMERKVNDMIDLVESGRLPNSSSAVKLGGTRSQNRSSVSPYGSGSSLPTVKNSYLAKSPQNSDSETALSSGVFDSNKALPPLITQNDQNSTATPTPAETPKIQEEEEEKKDDDADENTLSQTELVALEKINKQSPIELLQDLGEPPSSRQDDEDDDAFQVRLKNGGRVEIHETHTYKTEMQSSMRIVSDIEWLKAAIQQHHEAIRQVQQNMRTQSDNFDTLNENLIKANQSQNSKIAHMAQQIHGNVESIDANRKKVIDYVNQVQKKLLNMIHRDHSSQKPITLSASTSYETLLTDQPHETTQSRQVRKKIEALPPLPANFMKQQDEEEPKKSSARQAPPPAKEEKKQESARESPPKERHFTFTFSQFSTNDDLPFLMTKIDTRPRNGPGMKVFSHIDLFNSVPTPTRVRRPQAMPGRQQLKSKETLAGIGTDEELESPPPEDIKEKRTKVIFDDRQIRIGGRSPAPMPSQISSEDEENLYPQLQQELIEEKVGKEARKVIAGLSVSIQENVENKLAEMQKEVDKAVNLIDNKIDRTFVEKMFNKFRIMMKEINDKIDTLQVSFLDWVTRDELEMVLQRFMNILNNKSDSAGTTSKFTCLLCGRPKDHLSGMLNEAVQPLPMPASKPRTAVRTSSQVSRSMTSHKKAPQTKPSSPTKQPRNLVELLT